MSSLLTVWRYVDSCERCRYGCRPRLPESDLHDYGFACPCARTREERRRAWHEWRNNIKAFGNPRRANESGPRSKPRKLTCQPG